MKGLIIPFLTLLLWSCNSFSTEENTEQDTSSIGITDTISADTANLGTNTPVPEGIYQTILPCKGCRGIQHTISFSNDLKYVAEEEKWAKESIRSRSNGNWRPSDGSILAFSNGKQTGRYHWKHDTLMYSYEGKDYAMVKMTGAGENEVWKKRKEAGVEFFGVGNEPFWNVEIDEQKAIRFHLAEWEKPISFPAAQPVVSADSIQYTTKNDSLNLVVTVYSAFCSDGMSDFIYNNKVKVLFRGQTYSGCGMNYRRE